MGKTTSHVDLGKSIKKKKIEGTFFEIKSQTKYYVTDDKEEIGLQSIKSLEETMRELL